MRETGTLAWPVKGAWSCCKIKCRPIIKTVWWADGGDDVRNVHLAVVDIPDTENKPFSPNYDGLQGPDSE